MFKGPYHVDALMRLPLVWRPAPSSGPAPAVVHKPVGLIDLAPTFCAIAGVEVPAWMQGRPLPVDDTDADARGFERVLTEWDSELFGVDVHLRTVTRDGLVCTPTCPAPATTAPMASSMTWTRTRASSATSGRPGHRAERDDLVADLWDNQPPTRSPRLRLERRCERLLAWSVVLRGRRPRRQAVPGAGAALGISPGETVAALSRLAPAATMVVTRDPGEVFLLRHTAGDDAISFVERIDPITLEPLARSADLQGGPTWPGSLAAHANGSLYVVFGNHAHRLDAELSLLATTELPRRRPYNGFVVLADGSLVTRPSPAHARVTRSPPLRASAASSWCSSPSASGSSGARSSPSPRSPGCRLTTTRSTSSATRPCCGRTGTARTSSRRKASPALPHHGGADLRLGLRAGGGRRLVPRRRRGLGALLGDPSGHGVSSAPLHLVRTDLTTGAVTTAEICGLVGGLIANPPVIDEGGSIAVGFDTGNG